MNITCTLEFKSDTLAVYSDTLFCDEPKKARSAAIGGDRLTLATIMALNTFVKNGDKCDRAVLETLGCHLYNIAFGGSGDVSWKAEEFPIREAFESAYEKFNANKGETGKLRLRLVF